MSTRHVLRDARRLSLPLRREQADDIGVALAASDAEEAVADLIAAAAIVTPAGRPRASHVCVTSVASAGVTLHRELDQRALELFSTLACRAPRSTTSAARAPPPGRRRALLLLLGVSRYSSSNDIARDAMNIALRPAAASAPASRRARQTSR